MFSQEQDNTTIPQSFNSQYNDISKTNSNQQQSRDNIQTLSSISQLKCEINYKSSTNKQLDQFSSNYEYQMQFIIEEDLNSEEEDLIQEENLQEIQQSIINKIFNYELRMDYQNMENKIFQGLLKKNYFLESYIDQYCYMGHFFKGYFKNNEGINENCTFKIYFEKTREEFEKEIEIMKQFEKPINVVNFIDSLQIEQFFILIQEEYFLNLNNQLILFREKQLIFSFDDLLQIVFDLIDGLIQLRIYNIIHLDIKPAHILVSKEGNYVFTNFNTSFFIKNNKNVKNLGYTPQYSSPEVLKFKKNLDYQADVYSLGKTLIKVLNIFKQVNQDYILDKINIRKIIQDFQQIIGQSMIQKQSSQRLECQNLHEQFLSLFAIEQHLQFFLKYQKKLNYLNHLSQQDSNKDIPYFLKLKLYYNLINLNCIKAFEKKYLLKIDYNNIEYNIKKQSYQGNHPDIANSLNNVGICYRNLGNIQNCLQYQLESLLMRKQILQQSHSDIAQTMSSVGFCYQILGDYQKSLKYYQESLQIRKQIFQEIHPDIAASLNSLGLYYMKIGLLFKGLKYQLESLEMRKYIFQGNHHNIATSLNNVGICYKNLGDNQQGLIYSLESLEMRKQVFQGNHPDVADSLNNVRSCFQILGDFQNSLQYQLESLEMRRQIYQGNHPDIVASLDNVGSCYKNLGDNINVLKYSLESLDMKQQIFKGDHHSVDKSLNKIGACYLTLGDYQSSLKYQLLSLQMRKQIFQGNHSEIAVSLNNVGYCYIKIGDNENGLKYQLESLEMRKQIYQDNHPDIAQSLSNVGQCYQIFGQNLDSLRYQLESLEMRKQIFQGNHPSIASSLNKVGLCYKKLMENQKCVKYEQKQEEMKKKMIEEKQNQLNIQ